MTKRFWSCALMTFLSAAVSAGFSLEGLFGPGGSDSFARYAASRSVALLLTVLIAICIHSRMAIAFLGIAMAIGGSVLLGCCWDQGERQAIFASHLGVASCKVSGTMILSRFFGIFRGPFSSSWALMLACKKSARILASNQVIVT